MEPTPNEKVVGGNDVETLENVSRHHKAVAEEDLDIGAQALEGQDTDFTDEGTCPQTNIRAPTEFSLLT